MARKGAEFSDRIKNEEIRKWHGKNPGKENAVVEVHHILPINEGLKRGVPKEALRSQQNAVATETKFHDRVHRELDDETMNVLAQGLINLWKKLF